MIHPYNATTKYKGTPDFDSRAFYSWIAANKRDNTILVSEYVAPKDWKLVLEIETKTDMMVGEGYKEPRIERLFTI